VGAALVGPWAVGAAGAAPIPEYFEDEWVGFACLSSPSGAVLLQVNFDKLAGGGIAVGRADTLFARLTSSFGWLGELTGTTFQVTCTMTPTQVQASVPGLTARQAAQTLAGSFQQRGFPAYLILDSFVAVTPSYLGSDVAIRRTDAFRVVGPNDLTYLGSTDVVE